MRHRASSAIRVFSWFLAALAPASALDAAQARDKAPKEYRAFVWKSFGRGFLGVQVVSLTPELRAHFGAPEDYGVLVSRVEENGPAAAAGVLVGDVLTAIDGERIAGPPSLLNGVRNKKAGEAISLELYRDRALLSLTASIAERDRPVLDLAGIPFTPGVDVELVPNLGDHPVFIAGPGPRLDEDAVLALEGAMRELEDRFDSEEWREKLKRFRELDLGKIQERMKEVEERLRKLEDELEREGKNKPQE